MDSFKKFSEDKLPDKREFFSSLKDKCISEKDYSRDDSVWDTFKMNTMGDYHDLYLKTDVLLLADLFEKVIKRCLDYYGLDPCHYVSAPGLSWDAMLKITGIKLELISETDIHLFLEKEMRGRISYICKRYGKHIKFYDKTPKSIFIMYWDANNLYVWAMIQHLPWGEFKWLSEKEINKFWLVSVSENSSTGYILEVDLEYPDELHDLHNDYPLAPEKLEVSQDMLSKYCSNITNKY